MPYSVGIYQNKNSSFSDIICTALSQFGVKIRQCTNEKEPNLSTDGNFLSVYSVECAALLPDHLDICILESGYEKSNSFPQADTVIVPDICSVSTISQLNPKSVITYGLSCKNTVTVSSLIQNKLIISVQREIVSLEKKRIVEQEFSIDVKDSSQIEALLASVSLLLLLDVPIETIKHVESFPAAVI